MQAGGRGKHRIGGSENGLGAGGGYFIGKVCLEGPVSVAGFCQGVIDSVRFKIRRQG